MRPAGAVFHAGFLLDYCDFHLLCRIFVFGQTHRLNEAHDVVSATRRVVVIVEYGLFTFCADHCRTGSQDPPALEAAWSAERGHYLVPPCLGQDDYPATERAGRPLSPAYLRKPLHPERRQHPGPAEDPGSLQLGYDHALCALGT